MPPKWSALRKATQNRITAITAAFLVGVPFVVSLTESLGVSLNLPTNVYAGYLSALLFAMGVGIYSLCVPSAISEYADIHDYINKRKPELLTAFPDKKHNIVLTHLDETQSNIKSDIEVRIAAIEAAQPSQKDGLRIELERLVDPLYEGCVVRYLQKEWHKADTQQNKFALIAGCIFIVGGIALGGYILANNALTVFTHKKIL